MSTFVTGYDLWETASAEPPQPVAFDPWGINVDQRLYTAAVDTEYAKILARYISRDS